MITLDTSMYNYTYFVNEEAKVVVAKLEVDVECMSNTQLFALNCNKEPLPEYFTGVAHCKGDDAWDEEKGKKMARAKAKRSYKKYMVNCFNKATKVLKETLDSVYIEKDKYTTDIGNLTTLIKDASDKQ